MRSMYFLVSKVYLAEEVFINLESKTDNKVLVAEGTLQEFALEEEISKPVSDTMAYCGIFIS